MKIAYFHCFAGISGDMILGALVDAGLDLAQLQQDLAGLSLSGYRLEAEKVVKQGIGGTKVHVLTEDCHTHRHLSHIVDLLSQSELPQMVKDKSIQIFTRLAEAEAKVHRTSVEKIHFHEVGAVDAIVDIVGSVIGLWRLEIEEVYASAVHTGTGFIQCAHGIMPVPAPATMELLTGVPVYSRGIEQELATPTGAAILTAYAKGFGEIPPMRLLDTGYGAGGRDLAIPNLLRLSIGESDEVQKGSHGSMRFIRQEEAVVMEANIDDMNPEFYDYLMAKLFESGAMDVFLQSIQMKKNRPAVKLSLLIHPSQTDRFCQLVLTETTSIGVRVYPVRKFMLPYEIMAVNTQFGSVKVKVARSDTGFPNLKPEYEDCRRIAEETKTPVKEVYDTVKREAYQQLSE